MKWKLFAVEQISGHSRDEALQQLRIISTTLIDLESKSDELLRATDNFLSHALSNWT